MRSMMPKANTMNNALVEDWLQNAEIAEISTVAGIMNAEDDGEEVTSKEYHSTIAIIRNAEDDGEEVTSKYAPPPKKSIYESIKSFFMTRHNFGRYPFAKYL